LALKLPAAKKVRPQRLKPHAKQYLYRSAENAAPPESNRNIDLGAAAARHFKHNTEVVRTLVSPSFLAEQGGNCGKFSTEDPRPEHKSH
jgi:hypothetical protein